MDQKGKIIAAPQTAGEHIREEETFVSLGGSEDGYQLVTAEDGGSARKADSFSE
ncbi:MAG: hypothetical protein LBU81_02320 [Methanosarcinales archaeon]|jgi:CO dehydrogenase/acetyl-CoA synthase beta subunit|nr:hypothetical protein [Methanosarcinales archaeon]